MYKQKLILIRGFPRSGKSTVVEGNIYEINRRGK